ncbi:MAG: DinB family protein [Kineosporiaceae bacterium]
MTTTTTASPTADPAPALAPGSEKADLLAELAVAREALVRSTQGLDDEQIAQRPTVSALCLGGLVKHVTQVEAAWVRFIVEGTSAMSFDLPDGVTWEALFSGTAASVPQWMVERQEGFGVRPGETLASILAAYAEVAARTEQVVRELRDLNVAHRLAPAPWNEPGAVHTARRVLIHVIAETTQHAGHADLLRETIDGATAT